MGYDAASNVTGLDTTLGTGGIRGQTSTDNQSFCYDEQNRLVWATSQSASGPNGCASNTAGTLTGGGAQYTATYAYDTLDRLTSGPAGSAYTYGDASHLHAATSTSGGYSASYDASGSMLCRAPTSATTCAGSNPTGAVLGYDNTGQLTAWQNAPGSSPTATDAFASDGEGSRVAQKAVSTGVTTTTDYLLGGLEEVTNGNGTLTEYYPLPGIGTAVRVGSTLSYLAGDNLGSVSVALSSSGSVEAQQLYGPYGAVRYSSGQMPTVTDHGYTGQVADAATGLSYYGARYYDPALGQFASADTKIAGGLNRYAYVGGNPTSATDPSGNEACFECLAAAQGGDWFNNGGAGPSSTVVSDLLEYTLGAVSIYHDIQTLGNPNATLTTKVQAFVDALGQGGIDVLMLTGIGEGMRSDEFAGRAAENLTRAGLQGSAWADAATKAGLVADNALDGPGRVAADDAAKLAAADAAGDGGPHLHAPDGGDPHGGDPHGGTPSGGGTPGPCGAGGLSFSADTAVATPQGERPIASLHVGDAVEAYDPATSATSTQTVQHVFLNHDTDLLDVTLQTVQPVDRHSSSDDDVAATARHGRPTPQRTPAGTHGRDEVVHTTASHPWLTTDRGWEQAGVLRVGERVVRADGSSAMVVALHVVSGAAAMWDLTVSNVHTFVVGSGAYVVHNCPDPGGSGSGRSAPQLPPNYPTAFPPDFNDPTRSPGPDWQWKPPSNPPGTAGNWTNTSLKPIQSWHPDLGHGPPFGPHWDYTVRDIPGKWRWLQDGSFNWYPR